MSVTVTETETETETMMIGIEQTSSYDTEDCYTVQLYNDFILTTVTSSASAVNEWLNDIYYIHRRRLHKLIVGLDVEWRPSFQRNVINPVATLQLCVGRRCLIFQLIHADTVPQSLEDFLQNPDFTFVGVGIGEDVEKLQEDYQLRVEMTSDLRTLAANVYGRREMRQGGLMSLATTVLGVTVAKPRNIRLSRWDKRWLSSAQVQYACIDAFLSFEIGRTLIQEFQ